VSSAASSPASPGACSICRYLIVASVIAGTSWLGAARTAAGALALAVHLENRAIAAYLDALPRLTSPDLRGTAASMLTSDAEHLVVLRRELGEDPVPSAFAGGAG